MAESVITTSHSRYCAPATFPVVAPVRMIMW